jgi:hypothetical protein
MGRLIRVLGLACLAVLTFAGSALAARPRVAVGDATRLSRGAVVGGRLAAHRHLQVVVGMQSADPLGEAALAQAVSTPGNPHYGRFLSVDQFARRFGASRASLRRVTSTLRADGLTIDRTTRNRLSIVASGSVQEVQNAFDTRLAHVRLPSGRRTFANTTPATVPASLGRDVLAVDGLNGVDVWQPAGLHRLSRRSPAVANATPHAIATGGPQPCATATQTAARRANGTFAYTSDSIAAMYGLPALYAQGDFGQGQTIALYETESLDPQDIATYEACYGITTPVTIKPVNGPDPVDFGADGDAEAALDAEQIASLAPQANIVVYSGSQTTNESDGLIINTIASDDTSKTVSISYGACETLIGSGFIKAEAKVFDEMALQGQSVYASSGDQGAEGCGPPFGTDANTLAVDDPATQPTITATGATSAYVGNPGHATPWTPAQPLTEGMWNQGTFVQAGQTVAAASGGGVSEMWSMPAFQSSANPGLGVVNAFSGTGGCGAAACRETPDVSALGDVSTGTVIYANSEAPMPVGWETFGGTSASAPIWAAITALTDVQPSCRGLSVGDINGALYQLAGQNYGGYFRDITAPDPTTDRTFNDTSAGLHPGIFPVGPGYDMVSGLGSPLVAALAPALCALRAPVFTVAVAAPAPALTVTRGRNVSVQMTGTDSGNAGLVWNATGLPKGLTIDPLKGTITGRAGKLGRSTITVAAEDFATNAATTQFVLTVVAPTPLLHHIRVRGVAKRRGSLQLIVQRARGGAKVRSVTVRVGRRSGLSFGKRTRGIAIRNRHGKVKFTVSKRSHVRLTLRFSTPQKVVGVAIGRPTLKVSRKLTRNARSHRLHTKLNLSATDVKRRTTHRAVKLKLSSGHAAHHKSHHRHKKRHK